LGYYFFIPTILVIFNYHKNKLKNFIMASQPKIESVEKLEEATVGQSMSFMIQCLSDWMSGDELEKFTEYVESEI